MAEVSASLQEAEAKTVSKRMQDLARRGGASRKKQMQNIKLSRRLARSPAGGGKACLLQRQAKLQPQSQLQAAGLRSELAAQCGTWAGEAGHKRQ